MYRNLSIPGLLLVTFVTAGCQPPVGARLADKESMERLVWPQPPLRARIRFLRAVARPADLGISPSFIKRLAEALFGSEQEWFVRPTGVAARGDVIYVADPGAQALWILDPLGGDFHKVKDAGGVRLISPVAVTLGLDNQVYLADSYLAKVFIYDAKGKPLGAIADPALRRPAGLAFDASRDRLYIADSAGHRIWIFTGDGRSAGAFGRRGNGDGEFNFPTHVAVDGSGNIYVTDALGFRVQVFNSAGVFIGKFGRHGDSSGDFASPKGIAVDSEGHIYVVDALFDAVQIFERSGVYLLSFGDRGARPGQFWLPGGIFIDRHDRVYIADAYNQRIQIFQYLLTRKNG